MKLLEINVSSGMLSTGRICTDIAHGFVDKGNEACVAFGRDNYNRGIATVPVSNAFNILVDAFKSRIFDNSGFNNKIKTIKFIRWVKKYDPDIIHIHNVTGYYINVEILYKYLKTCNKKIIWTLHDCWPFTGHCAYFGKCEQWKDGCKNCKHKYLFPKSILLNKAKKHYLKKKELFTGIPNMTIVTPSQWLADLVKQSYLKEYDVKVINNGINLENFVKSESVLRERHNLREKKIVLGVASPWDKRKGYDDFLKLPELLGNEYQVVMIGLNKKQMKEIPSSILGFQRTDSVNELAQWYSTSNVFVNTTYEDNYPTVNLECQACGTPAITYKTGGSVESVPVENVVEQGNIDELVKKIKLVCNAKNELFKPFGISDMVNKYIELYMGIVE